MNEPCVSFRSQRQATAIAEVLMRRSQAAGRLVLLAALVALAGCGGSRGQDAASYSDSQPRQQPQATQQPPASAPRRPAPPQPNAAGQVAAGPSALGAVLTDHAGRTLYAFTKDGKGQPSSCYGECAAAWPPLLSDGPVAAGDGAQASQIGVTARQDGTAQLTYDGWPLYRYAGDQSPGDLAGQGLKGAWFVVSPTGKLLRTAADSTERPDAGYGP
jgi:predicted lipoprotein with Yx(FWY)xxD motif